MESRSKVLDGISWTNVPPPDEQSDLPFVVMEGVLRLGASEIRCYQLSDGNRVFDADDVQRFFGAVQ